MDPDQLYHLMIITLFVVVPEVFLVTCLVGLKDLCQELSNTRFFESRDDSISWPLLMLTVSLAVVGLL